MKIDFLNSPRFWALILGSASTVLIDPSFPTQEWYISVGKFLGLVSAGFIVVRTTDRATEVLSGRALPVEEKVKKK